MEIKYGWDDIAGEYAGNQKIVNNYDSNGKLVLKTVYSWNKIISRWVDISKYSYTYNIDGNMTKYINYNWDENKWLWIGTLNEEYNYGIDGKTMQTTFYDWNIYSEKWKISGKSTYYYSPQATPNSIIALKSDIKIYPNPVKTGFCVNGLGELSTIILSDINGRIWFSKEVVNNEFISVDALPCGIYLLRISTYEESVIMKLVKQ